MIILRGVPGSGKSTFAKSFISQNGGNGKILSTDDYFMQIIDGVEVYVYNRSLLSEAHNWNQERATFECKKQTTPLIIDNTFVKKWEAKFYIKLGISYGYSISIKEPNTKWWKERDASKMAELNSHNVDYFVIKRMIDNWEYDFTITKILASEESGKKEDRNSRGHCGSRRFAKKNPNERTTYFTRGVIIQEDAMYMLNIQLLYVFSGK